MLREIEIPTKIPTSRMHGRRLIGPTDLKLVMYLIRAKSREEADRIAASDPYTVVGDSTYELQRWNIRQIMGVGPFTAAGLGLADRGL